ncbi:sugar ABC transporter substrate-binding protein [Rhizobium rhizosphaerae]|uniref:Sugar ABC transporter substrate-binding protein n=1 Tax=Xaviernesmea rhizosphaerae TaxID=1672749 RepID=A0ABX3PF88_9HYPH|nr:substrate-binding domain-containing protein [Xaviernesmea rhizosphaerae]OQP87073.1 sugar ABC transporter substrate-binding protein [Xaviernesmea rhizosphaerae]
MTISGLGPHGERAAPAERIALTETDIAAAQEARFRVAIVLHTLSSDWAKQQIAGIMATFGDCATAVIEVVDCGFAPEAQIAALDRLRGEKPDAIISIPVANSAVAEAHRRVSKAGIRLLLLDNVPTGLLPGSDYVALVSADNFGLGMIAAAFLDPRLARGAAVGVLSYHAEFYATNEREIAFNKWMMTNRPDVTLHVRKFDNIQAAGSDALALVDGHRDLGGLFVVWDTPAMEAVKALRRAGHVLPVSTVDLGREAAIELASDGLLCGIGAQQPYLQGVAVAQTCVLALLAKQTPDWVALPGLAVSRDNVVESFQKIWRKQAPREVLVSAKLVTDHAGR